jgi:hypothetical protein
MPRIRARRKLNAPSLALPLSQARLPAPAGPPPSQTSANIALFFPCRFAHKDDMENQTGPQPQPQKPQPKSFLRWATTRPQSYVVYLVCLILVWTLSFFAGTLKPKKAEGLGPPPVMSPPR